MENLELIQVMFVYGLMRMRRTSGIKISTKKNCTTSEEDGSSEQDEMSRKKKYVQSSNFQK
jgi:hypothetical protein